MKIAVIIKHIGRDNDLRVDISEIPSDHSINEYDIRQAVNKKLMGNFEIIGISAKVCLDRKLEL